MGRVESFKRSLPHEEWDVFMDMAELGELDSDKMQ